MRNTWAHCDVGGTVSAGVGPQPRGPEKSPPSSGPRFLYQNKQANQQQQQSALYREGPRLWRDLWGDFEAAGHRTRLGTRP